MLMELKLYSIRILVSDVKFTCLLEQQRDSEARLNLFVIYYYEISNDL